MGNQKSLFIIKLTGPCVFLTIVILVVFVLVVLVHGDLGCIPVFLFLLASIFFPFGSLKHENQPFRCQHQS